MNLSPEMPQFGAMEPVEAGEKRRVPIRVERHVAGPWHVILSQGMLEQVLVVAGQ